MPTNFHLAPPPKMVDGLLAVPIDIQSVKASFVFDGAAQTGTAGATVQYIVGPADGNPIFDLRQEISQAWLDGAVFPVAQLGSHDFGEGMLSGLRILESVQTAGSLHELRVQYELGIPLSQLGGSYPPALEWAAGPRLRFSFGLSDLNAGRYAEAWLPANLIFDQFPIELEIEILNTALEHRVITNGQVTSLGFNHWSLAFPDRFTALSPLLEVRAADTLQFQSDTVLLPVSGETVTIEAWKLTSGGVNLATQINNIKGFLTDNENGYGAYAHGDRFVAFFHVGGMEYEGGTTTGSGALLHETFHSWYARGIKPASQADGWWDEAFTTWHDSGANDALPFDFSDPPITLCSRNPWQRTTPGNAYSDGETFWRGMADLLGVGSVNTLLADLYDLHKGGLVSTRRMEEFLVAKNGNPRIVDAFHRFVYGFADPVPSPQLWLRDDPGHTGSDDWGGIFWDSPDLWVRHADDGGLAHQSPEHGQDNWFYARVRNQSGAGVCRHFVVTFNCKGFAGTQFVYPGDFLPSVAATAEFDLGPGETRIVKARWPRALVPPADTHTCLLASVLTRSDQPVAGKHVWEHNNLAQKNLTVVDLLPDSFIIIPVVIANQLQAGSRHYGLEAWRGPGLDHGVSLIHPAKDFFKLHKGGPLSRWARPAEAKARPVPEELLDCGGHIHAPDPARGRLLLTSDQPERIAQRLPEGYEAAFPPGRRAQIPVSLPPSSRRVVGLKVAVPANAKRGTVIETHLVQRDSRTRKITGGVAVQIRVR